MSNDQGEKDEQSIHADARTSVVGITQGEKDEVEEPMNIDDGGNGEHKAPQWQSRSRSSYRRRAEEAFSAASVSKTRSKPSARSLYSSCSSLPLSRVPCYSLLFFRHHHRSLCPFLLWLIRSLQTRLWRPRVKKRLRCVPPCALASTLPVRVRFHIIGNARI